MPAVSVIIPTYNRRAYLFETLASVWAQEFKDYEVIVVDDGSTDDTAEALRPLAESGRIRYIKQSNAGQAAARNHGLAQARGRLLAFIDDDDLWPPDKLGWQVAALEEHPDWVIVSGLAGYLEEGDHTRGPENANGTLEMQSVEVMFFGSLIISPGQVLIRREAMEKAGGFNTVLAGCEDLDLWMRLAAQGPAAMVRKCALLYRLHATNYTRSIAPMFWSGVQVARKNLPLVPRDRRGHAWRGALRSIYIYSGSKVVCAGWDGGGRRALGALRVLAYLAWPMLRDADLAKMVGRDLLPERLRRPFARLLKPLSAG